jgi:hypothetical protein
VQRSLLIFVKTLQRGGILSRGQEFDKGGQNQRVEHVSDQESRLQPVIRPPVPAKASGQKS